MVRFFLKIHYLIVITNIYNDFLLLLDLLLRPVTPEVEGSSPFVPASKQKGLSFRESDRPFLYHDVFKRLY